MISLGHKGVPLYLQLSEALEKRIDGGEFRPGDKLPGDLALSTEYAVSIITARAAMRVLIDKLRVVRYPGKGSFVRKDDDDIPVWGIGSMFDLILIGLQTKLILLDRRLVVPPEWAAKKFAQAPTSRLYVIKIARESQGERFSISDAYYQPRIGKLMEKADLENPASQSKLMINVLQEQTGIRARETYQTMTAEIAGSDDARKLNLKPGAPLLVVDRDYYDSSGELIQAARTKYRVDHYQYRIGLSSSHPPSRSGKRILKKPGQVARLSSTRASTE